MSAARITVEKGAERRNFSLASFIRKRVVTIFAVGCVFCFQKFLVCFVPSNPKLNAVSILLRPPLQEVRRIVNESSARAQDVINKFDHALKVFNVHTITPLFIFLYTSYNKRITKWLF